MGLERRAFNRFICLQGTLMVIRPTCSLVVDDLTNIHKVTPLSAWICCIPQRNFKPNRIVILKSSTHSTRRSLGTMIAAGGCSWSPYVVALTLPNKPWSPLLSRVPIHQPAGEISKRTWDACALQWSVFLCSLFQRLFMRFLLGRLGLKRYSLRHYLKLLRGLASNSTWAFCIFLTSICGVEFLVLGSWLSDSALGQSPQPTCKGQTERDLMIWLGSEAAALFCRVGMKFSAAMVLKVARALTGGHLVFQPQHTCCEIKPYLSCVHHAKQSQSSHEPKIEHAVKLHKEVAWTRHMLYPSMSGRGDDAIHMEHLGLRWNLLSHKLGVDCKLEDPADAWGVVLGQAWLPHTDKVLGRQDMKAPGSAGGSLVWLAPCGRLLAFSCTSLGKRLWGQLQRSMQQFNGNGSIGWIFTLWKLQLVASSYAWLYETLPGPCVLASPRGLANHASHVERRRDTSGQWRVLAVLFSFRVKSTDRWS